MLYTATRLSSHTGPVAGHELLDKLYSVLKTSSSSHHHSVQTTVDECVLFCKVLWLRADVAIETGKFVEARNGLVSCISFVDHVMEEGKGERRGEGREERRGEESLQEFKVSAYIQW